MQTDTYDLVIMHSQFAFQALTKPIFWSDFKLGEKKVKYWTD
jgi:hypothetical protein